MLSSQRVVTQGEYRPTDRDRQCETTLGRRSPDHVEMHGGGVGIRVARAGSHGVHCSGRCRERARAVPRRTRGPAIGKNTGVTRADRTFFAWNAVVSTAAIAFIAYILGRRSPGTGTLDLSFMPAVNATCNALASVCLVTGWVAVRKKAVQVHRACMVTALAFSTVFLVGYLAYHYVHGDTRYTGAGVGRVIYLTILATHILLSTTVVPGALTSLYFALTRQFERHRRLNRVFLPIWLYVSVTGVLIYFMLR